MADTIYLIFFIVGLFSILLGTLAVLIPDRLTNWEEKLCRKLRLISKNRPTREVKPGKFILERLLHSMDQLAASCSILNCYIQAHL